MLYDHCPFCEIFDKLKSSSILDNPPLGSIPITCIVLFIYIYKLMIIMSEDNLKILISCRNREFNFVLLIRSNQLINNEYFYKDHGRDGQSIRLIDGERS